jgi:hypothetical protein
MNELKASDILKDPAARPILEKVRTELLAKKDRTQQENTQLVNIQRRLKEGFTDSPDEVVARP